MDPSFEAKRGTFAGVFLITLATLMYEILLTRIFSVILWYHYAFLVISVAMFGMTVGALVIYLGPSLFQQDQAKHRMAFIAMCFGLSIVFCFVLQLSIPIPTPPFHLPPLSMFAIYIVSAVPFFFSGMCVCLALTKFPRQVSALYAADLLGAAVGCILLIYTLKVTDAATAVMLLSFLAALAALLFACDSGSPSLRRSAVLVTIVLGCFAVGHAFLAAHQLVLFPIGVTPIDRVYEKWNSFSRITVSGDPDGREAPSGGTLSGAVWPVPKVAQLHLVIDSAAATVLTGFRGDSAEVEFLKYDLVNLAHHLRRNARVLVVGAGGGRDVLSALVFGQKAVVAVEINENILEAVNGRFGDFTGHLDRRPNVTFVNDEARSFIARSQEKFDIIQASLVDTWAATAAGAFVLAENSVYTMEAWKVFLEHLAPDGILTFTRWYFPDRPGEIYRLIALATAALMESGAENPRDHVAVAKSAATGPGEKMCVLLVGRQPFSGADIDALETIAQSMGFDLCLTPRFAADAYMARLASPGGLEALSRSLPINIAPPTDDKPFFFNMLRLRDVFSNQLLWHEVISFNLKAVQILTMLLMTVLILTLLCILLPLLMTWDKTVLKGAGPLLLFFGAIGFGFMLIEVSQMQRLVIFLGHPTYGLSVVLFALLLSSGLGSYMTGGVGDGGLRRAGIVRLALLLGALGLFGLATPHVIRAFASAVTTARIFLAAATLAPIGLFMGMAFPLGMEAASSRAESLTPWLWGINGATSVCASMLAVAIALEAGISASFWTGFFCYAVAFIAFLWAVRGRP